MKRFPRIALALIVVLTLAAGTLHAKGKDYVKPADVDLTKLLPPPPAQDSEQTKKEIKEILDFQKNRTAKMVECAVADQDVDVFRFADVLGANFTKEKLPFTAGFFNRVLGNELDITEPAKDFWKRPRPGAYDSRIKPCIRAPVNPSYPSGHSAAGNLMAIILANMLPEKSADILRRGWEFAMNRVIGGVHYRSDAESGKLAATLIAAYMFNNSGFKADYERSKAEVRKALGYDRKTVTAGAGVK
jgi:acid phosphatase (class A)